MVPGRGVEPPTFALRMISGRNSRVFKGFSGKAISGLLEEWRLNIASDASDTVPTVPLL